MIGMSLRFLGFVCSSLRRIRSASKLHWFPSDIVAICIGDGIEVAFRDETTSRDISRILRQTSSRSSYSVGPPSVAMEKTVLVNFVRKFEEGDGATCDAYRTCRIHSFHVHFER